MDNAHASVWYVQANVTGYSEMVEHRRVLALDVGKRRIGLAISDALGITAQGLPTLERTTIREDLARLGDLTAELYVSLFLIGEPLHMSGDKSRQAQYIRDFSERLRQVTAVPFQLWDERLTTMQAQRVLKESGISI